jgi:hypothetical protein
MTLVVALASVPICVVLAGSFFPLLEAKVCTSQSEVKRLLIGETSDRTYIGETGGSKGPADRVLGPGGRDQGDVDRWEAPAWSRALAPTGFEPATSAVACLYELNR